MLSVAQPTSHQSTVLSRYSSKLKKKESSLPAATLGL